MAVATLGNGKWDLNIRLHHSSTYLTKHPLAKEISRALLLVDFRNVLVNRRGASPDASNCRNTMTTKPEESERATISVTDLSKHNTKSDCWIAVHSKVWDITDFINEHPGGPSGESGTAS